MNRSTIGLAASAWVLATCLAAEGEVIFNNLTPMNGFQAIGRIVQGESVGTIGNVDQASSFTVGPNDYFLTELNLGMGVASSPASGVGPLDVLLAADAGGSPGAILRTFSLVINAVGDQLVTAVDDGSFQLDANTTYWVIADGLGDFNGAWRFNSTGDVGLTAGRSNGNPWNVRIDDDRYALRVDGNLVPEPALCGSLLVPLFWGVLRRRRKTLVH